MTWKIQSRSKHVSKSMRRAGAISSAEITDEFGQTRHVWKINGSFRDVDGNVYEILGEDKVST